MSEPVLLARGRTADVFALDPRRVLRRYRDGADASAEAAVMTYVGGLGFAVPTVEAVAGIDLVMERLDGPTMLAALAAGTLDPRAAARLLADLHAHLHSLPARISRDPAVRILHLDLHPGNVVLSTRGAVVIDWRNTTEGPPELDVALTALMMAEVAVDEATALAGLAAAALRSFLVHAGGDLRGALPRAAACRAADPCLTGDEVRRLPRAVAMVAAVGQLGAIDEPFDRP